MDALCNTVERVNAVYQHLSLDDHTILTSQQQQQHQQQVCLSVCLSVSLINSSLTVRH